jgi:hypothetical protein
MKYLEQIAAAGQAGDREAVRARLSALWEEAADDRQSRCAIAHFLADVQDDTEDELTWDLRALEAADPADPTTQGMLPSLHLSLADDYRRLGETSKAEEHLAVARANLGVLGADDYGDLLRDAVEHVTAALAAGSTARLETNPSS